jgi:hypothetical protein
MEMQKKKVIKTFRGDSQNVHRRYFCTSPLAPSLKERGKMIGITTGFIKTEKGKPPGYQTFAIQTYDVTGGAITRWPVLTDA